MRVHILSPVFPCVELECKSWGLAAPAGVDVPRAAVARVALADVARVPRDPTISGSVDRIADPPK